ncbi:unnamed protein product [Symbiodinium natans]|uniref:Ubiquitin-like domain-containing protein n=1 Tax=Symbiodinium natans TaxID=878477 RepID=A0A812QB66_9DINO|nr:unnamed protein product [Symbiodinium natans]
MAAMDVEVHALSGVLLCALQVQGNQTVADLKGLVHKSTQIKPAVQKLLLGPSVLRNTDSLSELLTQGAVNEVVLLQTDKWIEEVAQDWRRLRKASEAVRNDKDLVLAAIERSQGEAVKFAGDDIRADREVMLAAMKCNGSLYRYANPSLGLDMEFMLAVLHQPPCRHCPLPSWQWHTSPEMCSDKSFILLMVARKGLALQHAASELRGDEEVVRAAMSEYPLAFQHASHALRSNRDFARYALTVGMGNFIHVADELKGDRRFILDCLPAYHGNPIPTSILKHLPQTLHSDREVVLRALEAVPPCHRKAELSRAAKDLQSCSELKEAAGVTPSRAVRMDAQMAQMPLPTEQPGPGSLLAEVQQALQYSTAEAQNKQSFWRTLVDKDPALLTMLGQEAADERELVLAAVKKDGRMLVHASDDLLLDVGLVGAALEDDAAVYDLLPEATRCNAEIALLAFRRHRIKLPKALLSNRHVVVEAAAIQTNATDVEKRRLQKLPLAHLVAKFELA